MRVKHQSGLPLRSFKERVVIFTDSDQERGQRQAEPARSHSAADWGEQQHSPEQQGLQPPDHTAWVGFTAV